MASAVVESSPKVPTRGFYQALRDSFTYLSINDTKSPRDPTAAEIEEAKPREDPVNRTESSSEVQEPHHEGEKPKKKFGKKKEIVSSSTVVPRLEVCIGKKCKARGSEALLTEFRTAIDGRVELAHTKCMHECKKGMNTRVTKDGTAFEWHHEVSSADVTPVLCQHFDW